MDSTSARISGGTPVISEFGSSLRSSSSVTDKLDIARVVTDSKRSILEFVNGKASYELSRIQGKLLACYADRDNIADLVSINRGSIIVRELNGSETEYEDIHEGSLIGAVCGDANGDAIDEVTILERLRSGRRTAYQLVIIALRNGQVRREAIKQSNAVAIAAVDADNDGLTDICVANNNGASYGISCNTRSGEMTLSMAPFRYFIGGSFIRNGEHPEGSFAVLSKDKKAYIVSMEGDAYELHANTASGPKRISGSSVFAISR
jgi:hypothetical protein